ncbi:MAG: heavy metal sensor histidine kinase [Bryobacteraceae bacterium]|jgi:two-component system heavy metal sensor histidine kinase CusS
MFWRTLREISPRAGRPGRASLALLLTAWYTLASFLVVTAATGLLYLGLANNLRKISEQSLLDELDVCRALVRERGGDSQALHEEVEIDSAVRRYQKFYIRVLDASGAALSTTPGMDRDLSLSRLAQAAEGQPGIFWIDSPGGAPYRAIVARLTPDSTRRDTWTLQMAVDLTQEQVVLGRQRVWVWAVLAAALIFCPGVGFAIARRGTRPLREVAETARHISSSTLNERIRAEGYPVEVAVLGEAFNAMLERLEESFARLSRFSADIAHELRTPVNNIRGEAEVALARTRTPEEYGEVLASCLEESVRLSELIESLLFLARSESPGDHLKRTREDLGRLLTDLRDYYEATATEMGVTLTASVGDSVWGDVDRALLQRALGNLVSNALAHCSAGDGIRLNARRQGGQICMEVRDTGSGISVEALPRVFDRFYRADPARSRNSGGAGLGLAIVRQIVYLHGGDVQISSERGSGTTVSVVLPQSA